MQKIILTDIDDVVLAWEFPFHTWMETHGYMKKAIPSLQFDVATTYNLSDMETDELIQAFNDSAAIGFLPPLRDAQEYIKKLYEDGYRFIAVTASTSDEFAKQLRIRNIKKMFGEETFLDFFILPIGASKFETLSMLAKEYPGAYWVEDSPEHAFVGHSLGFKTFLMLHGRNKVSKYDPRVTAVPDWETIYSTICEDQKECYIQQKVS